MKENNNYRIRGTVTSERDGQEGLNNEGWKAKKRGQARNDLPLLPRIDSIRRSSDAYRMDGNFGLRGSKEEV